MGSSRFVRCFAPLAALAFVLVSTAARADEVTPKKTDPGPPPEGVVLASVGGVGMGVGLGLMVVGALSNVSVVPGGSGCEQYREAAAVNDCRVRYDAERARDEARASTKVRNGAIVTGIGGVALLLGVVILVSSVKPEVRKAPASTGGLQVKLLPDVAQGEGTPRPGAGLAVEMPLVGGTF